MVSVFHFKDLLRLVDMANSVTTGVWDPDVLQWMQYSLDLAIASSDFRKAQLQQNFDTLAKAAKVLFTLSQKVATMEEDWATQRMGPSMEGLETLINFSWCAKSQNLLEGTVFLDKLEVRVAEVKSFAFQTMRKVNDGTKSLMEDFCWVHGGWQ